MPRIVAQEDARENQFTRRGIVHTPFLEFPAPPEFPDWPVAFMSEGPKRVVDSHYHKVDEFLVIVGGSGMLGRDPIDTYSLLFARAYTPYGPLAAGEDGLSMFVLYPRYEFRAQYLSEAKEQLKQIPNRKPFQVKRKIKFPTKPQSISASGCDLQEVSGFKDDGALAAYTLVMAPNAKMVSPDASKGDGQYILIVEGSLRYGNRERKAFTIVFVEATEGSINLEAGDEGLMAIVMNYPKSAAVTHVAKPAPAVQEFKVWQCELCAFFYDESQGLPAEGIPAGTRWEDVPETWSCPDCDAVKSDFQMVEL